MDITEFVANLDDGEAVYGEGLEEALVGFSSRFAEGPLATYDIKKVIDIFMNRDGMTFEDANEYFEYNVLGSWVGDRTPVFITFPDNPIFG